MLVGLSLGLLGSGGSILTVPVLVFVVGRPEKVAIAESLAIVGLIALVGALPRIFGGRVSGRAVLGFGLPGMVGAALGAQIGLRVAGAVQLMVFSVVMVAAGVALLRPPRRSSERPESPRPWATVLQGLAVGTVTGLVGVGGGFLIVPALVLLVGLPLREALGTSLSVIALQSAVGFVRYGVEYRSDIDLAGLVVFAAIGSVGALVGGRLAERIPQRALQRIFAVLLLLGGGALFFYYLGDL